ncbi:hypothetical protein PISMIDRAFT_146483 [Pisolithus microcarpus 441]|uniref:Unplaced genomic scaffold scaffold_10, whole genome shotgun sequence n=1 Tax=Pisolithus microcarpus 441 TaxID=765257 RepID=A0A0C9YSJ5_9AGAM|nr:hypothetical protein PISMIDRAFT_146483 [Pisolithus microcarpus 441]
MQQTRSARLEFWRAIKRPFTVSRLSLTSLSGVSEQIYVDPRVSDAAKEHARQYLEERGVETD